MRASVLLTLWAGVAGLILWAAPAGGADEVEDEPLLLKRELVLPDRVPAALERARQEGLVKLPLEEFEKRVQRAREALRSNVVAAAARTARLREAIYKASLVEAPPRKPAAQARDTVEPYLLGRGHWTIRGGS